MLRTLESLFIPTRRRRIFWSMGYRNLFERRERVILFGKKKKDSDGERNYKEQKTTKVLTNLMYGYCLDILFYLAQWPKVLLIPDRIIEQFGLEGTYKGHLVQPPWNEQRHQTLDQVAQSPIQRDFKCFHW